jgi:hypothetical protein
LDLPAGLASFAIYFGFILSVIEICVRNSGSFCEFWFRLMLRVGILVWNLMIQSVVYLFSRNFE